MDAEAWNERYDRPELIWSAEANRTLMSELSGAAPGRALDLACGEGRNAVWLAQNGWEVTAVDFSDVALRKAITAASAAGVSINTVAADVRDYEVTAEFDLVLLAYLQLPWPALRKLLESASRAVAPGGTLLLVSHDVDNLTDGFGGPEDPALLQTPVQVVAALPGLTVQRADRARRSVPVEGGVRYAIDTVVRATAPSPTLDGPTVPSAP